MTQKVQKSLSLRDTALCTGLLPLKISVPTGFVSYLWSNGSTSNQSDFWATGTYSLTATYECGVIEDTFHFEVLEQVPDFELGDSLNLCVNGQDILYTLAPSTALPNYRWSTEESSSSILVSNPGLYWLRSFNFCGEKTDSITVVGCPAQIYIPNIFSPNGDGENDMFNAFGRNIGAITLQIFDRWGNLVYRETGSEFLEGWDGNYRGKSAAIGVYIYTVHFFDPQTGQYQHLEGSVTLIR